MAYNGVSRCVRCDLRLIFGVFESWGNSYHVPTEKDNSGPLSRTWTSPITRGQDWQDTSIYSRGNPRSTYVHVLPNIALDFRLSIKLNLNFVARAIHANVALS